MRLFTDPVLFNLLIMGLSILAIARWAWERNLGLALYWVNALGITATVTFLFEDPVIGEVAAAWSFNLLTIPLIVIAMAFSLSLVKPLKNTVKASPLYSIMMDPRFFDCLIIICYGVTSLRWTLAESPANATYWFFAFGITFTVTFILNKSEAKPQVVTAS